MAKTDFIQIWHMLEALVPVYDPESGGNFTQVLAEEKELQIDTRKLKTVHNDLAKALGRHKAALKQKAGQLLGRKINLPIPYHQELILVPLKIRKVRAKDDGAMAYVNMVKVQDWWKIGAGDFKTEIEFDSGRKLKVQNRVSKVNEAKMECNRLLQKMNAGEPPFIGWNGGVKAKEEVYEYIIYKKNSPKGTRG